MENITTTHHDQINADTNNNNNNNITHDFMSVQSFSQLPFIRPPLIKLDKPIRLFGIEFSPDQTSDEDDDAAEPNNNDNIKHQEPTIINVDINNTTGESTSSNNNRKFECHYCCRNFPTSQALGGHQNAHKRERQHAKRAHLHSAAILHGAIGTWPPPSSSSSLAPYPSRFYENHHGSYYTHPPPHQPINGSPMGLWRINPTLQTSSFHRGRPLPHSITPMFTDHVTDQSFKPRPPPPQSLMNMGTHIIDSPPAGRYFYDSKPTVQDHHVSLDLHL